MMYDESGNLIEWNSTCFECGKPARGAVPETADCPAHVCRQCADHCALTAYYRVRAAASASQQTGPSQCP